MNRQTEPSQVGLPASELEPVFRKAGVLTAGLDSAKSANAKATRIGRFLSPLVGREARINVNGRPGTAKLCMRQGRAKQKLYYFEIRMDDPEGSRPTVPVADDGEVDAGPGSPAGGVADAAGPPVADAQREDVQPQTGNAGEGDAGDGDGGDGDVGDGDAGNAEQW